MSKLLIPNSTQIPNLILDQVMAFMPDREFKCLLYICRRTYGFQKDSDSIGLNQFVDGIKTKKGEILDHGAGISRLGALRALKMLEGAGFVKVRRGSTKGGGNKVNIYSLNLDMNISECLKKLSELKESESFKKVKKNNLFSDTGSIRTDTSVRMDTTSGIRTDTTPSIRTDTHNTKGNIGKQSISGQEPAYEDSQKKKNQHQQFIEYWEDLVPKTRGVPAVVTKADKSNLGRIMSKYRVSFETLQKVGLYFLAHYSFKEKFAPSMSTFLSAGIITGLLNHMQNNPDFWKRLDGYAGQYLKTAPIEADRVAMQAELRRLMEEFRSKTLVPKVNMESYQH